MKMTIGITYCSNGLFARGDMQRLDNSALFTGFSINRDSIQNEKFANAESFLSEDSLGSEYNRSYIRINRGDISDNIEPPLMRELKKRMNTKDNKKKGKKMVPTNRIRRIVPSTINVTCQDFININHGNSIISNAIFNITCNRHIIKIAWIHTYTHYFYNKIRDVITIGSTDQSSINIYDWNETFEMDNPTELSVSGYVNPKIPTSPLFLTAKCSFKEDMEIRNYGPIAVRMKHIDKEGNIEEKNDVFEIREDNWVNF